MVYQNISIDLKYEIERVITQTSSLHIVLEKSNMRRKRKGTYSQDYANGDTEKHMTIEELGNSGL